MKYTWTCFFWEIRAVFSTALVLFFFYNIRLIDSLLKHFLELQLTHKIELPVEIEDLTLDLWNKKCYMKGIIIMHPSVEEDPRWHYEYLCYAKSITFTFDPLQSLYAFFKSNFSLFYAEEIVVQTIDLYVEGFEDTVFDSEGNMLKNKILNLELLGGHVDKCKRQRKTTQAQAQTQKQTNMPVKDDTSRLKTCTSKDNETTPFLTPKAPSTFTGSSSSCTNSSNLDTVRDRNSDNTITCKDSPGGKSHPTTAVATVSGNNSCNILNPAVNSTGSATHQIFPTSTIVPVTQNQRKKSWASSALSLGINLGTKIHKLNKEVQQDGLFATVKTKTAQAIAVTVNTVDAVYKNAKKTIGLSYHSKINRLHEKLRGGEPIPLPIDLYVQVRSVLVLDLEITLHQTLPPSLSQLEKKPLYVPRIALADVKKDWMPPSSQKANATSTSTSATAASTTASALSALTASAASTIATASKGIATTSTVSGTSASSTVRSGELLTATTMTTATVTTIKQGQESTTSSTHTTPKSILNPVLSPNEHQHSLSKNEKQQCNLRSLSLPAYDEINILKELNDDNDDDDDESDNMVKAKNTVDTIFPIAATSTTTITNSTTTIISSAKTTSNSSESESGQCCVEGKDAPTSLSTLASAALPDKRSFGRAQKEDVKTEEGGVSMDYIRIMKMTLGLFWEKLWHAMITKVKEAEAYINNTILAETYEGIPAIVVAYYFERILLHEILKDNAGRMLQDVVKEGLGWMHVEGEDDEGGYYDFDYDTHMLYQPPAPASSSSSSFVTSAAVGSESDGRSRSGVMSSGSTSCGGNRSGASASVLMEKESRREISTATAATNTHKISSNMNKNTDCTARVRGDVATETLKGEEGAMTMRRAGSGNNGNCGGGDTANSTTVAIDKVSDNCRDVDMSARKHNCSVDSNESARKSKDSLAGVSLHQQEIPPTTTSNNTNQPNKALHMHPLFGISTP